MGVNNLCNIGADLGDIPIGVNDPIQRGISRSDLPKSGAHAGVIVLSFVLKAIFVVASRPCSQAIISAVVRSSALASTCPPPSSQAANDVSSPSLIAMIMVPGSCSPWSCRTCPAASTAAACMGTPMKLELATAE